MDKNLEIAREKLIDGEYCSRERGVKPLLSLLDGACATKEAFAADKTVGAGAAHLYVLLGVRAIWARVISVSAKQVLEDNNIEVFYDECVEYIINRRGDGMCPIEAAVADAKDSHEAHALILEALKKLQSNQTNLCSDSKLCNKSKIFAV